MATTRERKMNCAVATCAPTTSRLHHVEAGEGETVLLLHGSAGSGTLWRETARMLQPFYRVVVPDLIGYGRSPPWPAGVPFTVDAERAVLAALTSCCDEKYHLVGYSYGGVVALALKHPTRVRTLTLIEPVFFAALDHAGESDALDRLRRVRDEFASALARDEPEMAMQQFIDFWTGAGSWGRLSAPIRAQMLAMTNKIRLDWDAAFTFAPGLESIAELGSRTALLRGDQSPEPMRRLVDALHTLMPGSLQTTISQANHLLPLTHATDVTRVILAGLSRTKRALS
jgi:pimeloyl-ACP methyl ester carboxylesterase